MSRWSQKVITVRYMFSMPCPEVLKVLKLICDMYCSIGVINSIAGSPVPSVKLPGGKWKIVRGRNINVREFRRMIRISST